MLPDSLRCPRCTAALTPVKSGVQCQRCSTPYPIFGGIPCLVEDPALWRALWLSRLESYSASVEMRSRDLKKAAEEEPALLPRTRSRLLRVASALDLQVEQLDALFDPVQASVDFLPALAVPSRPESGAPAAALESLETVFRDWVWGHRERQMAAAVIKQLLPSGLSRVAVYSPSAGIAVDVHETCSPEETFALGWAPVPLLAAGKLLAGDALELVEMPVDPTSDDQVVIHRKVSGPSSVREGLGLVFADPLRPPFAPGSLDAVVTGWFIDAARTDLKETAASINRSLRPGGAWINLGPLRFSSVISRAHTVEEVLDTVAAGGFELSSSERHTLPYLDSPSSGSHCSQAVLSFAARKTVEAPAFEVPAAFPPWVANPSSPIPVTPGLIALARTSMFTSAVLSLIDGTRSIVDIAQVLAGTWGVEPARIQDELRAFLAKLPTG